LRWTRQPHDSAADQFLQGEEHCVIVMRPPHTTHKLQGEDVQNFKNIKADFLKSKMQTLVDLTIAAKKASQNVPTCIGMKHFIKALKPVWDKHFARSQNVKAWEKIGVFPFTRRVYWDLKADEEKTAAALESAGITELNYNAARDVALGEDDDDNDDDEEDDEEPDEVDEDDIKAAVERLLQGGVRLTSAHIWGLDGGITADASYKAIEFITTAKVTATQEADNTRKRKADAALDKQKNAREESASLIERFKADVTDTKKKMNLPELKTILLAYNIVIPPGGGKKVDLVKLIKEAGLG
jgi:hypothetical protein